MHIWDDGDSQLQNSYDFNVIEFLVNSIINNNINIQNMGVKSLFYNDLISEDKIKTKATSPEHSFQQKVKLKQQVQPQQSEQLYVNFATTMDYNEGIMQIWICHKCHYIKLILNILNNVSLHHTNIKHIK